MLVENLQEVLQEHKFHPLNYMSPSKFISLNEHNKLCNDLIFYKFFSESQNQWYLLKISSRELEHEALSEPDYSFMYQLYNSDIFYYVIWRIDHEATFL